MGATERAIASSAYALFALEQPMTLDELAAAARETRLPMARSQTPDWFAAAVHEDYDLRSAAPELLVLPPDLEAAAKVDVSGIDLIHVYAPPEPVAERAQAPEAEEEPAPPAAAPPREQPGMAAQLGLLRELGDLE